MNGVKFVTLFSILMCLLIVIPAGFAMDNETAIANEDNVLSSVEDDVLSDEYYFDASVENDTGSGSIDSPYKEFNSQRIQDNSIIHLNQGEYNFNGVGTIKNVTIIGDSALTTIVRNAQFNVADSFVIHNLTLVNSSVSNSEGFMAFNSIFRDSSSAMYGGAINSNGYLKLDNCTFINNTAVCGGAIYVSQGIFDIQNSLFIGNYAYLFGGAIVTVKSNQKMVNITCKNNRADYDGGVIYSIYGNFSLSDSTFENNSAKRGGALFIDHADYDLIVNNTFVGDVASQKANDIYSFYNFNSNISNNGNLGDDGLIETNEVDMFISNGNYTLYAYNPADTSTIPDRYDLREFGYVTPVKSQGSNGNCWAFATMATLESNILKALGDSFDLSESNLKNLFGSFSDYGWDYETNKGGIASMGYNYLISWLGPVLEEDDPYVLNSIFSPLLNSIMHVQNVMFIQRKSLTDNDEIKKIIMDYGAIYTQIYSSFSNNKQYYHDGINANHAVVIVGWDDSLTFSGAPGKGGWIIKNSWGSRSGDNGYYYVSYYDTSCLPIGKVDSAFTFILNDTIRFDKNYQYDIQGKSDFFLNSYSTVWYKNKFNATDNEYLAAVSTIFDKDTDYEFSVYVNGEYRLSQSGSSKPGYYTFNLNEFIPLSAGDVFEIVFKITVDGEAGVPISEKVSFNTYYYKESTSFISYDGTNWKDLFDYEWKYTSHTYNSQVACIKAFTIYDLVNTTVELTVNITDVVTVKAKVLNQYGRPVNGGYIAFAVNGEEVSVPVVNGFALIELNGEPKNYHIDATFTNSGYNSSGDSISFDVPLINTTVELTVDDFYNPVNLTASVLNQYGYLVKVGTITFCIDGVNYTVDIVNGSASMTHEFHSLDVHNVSAKFNGIGYYNSSADEKSFSISIKNTTATLSVDNEYNPIVLTLSVIDQYGNPVGYGFATFIFNDGNFTVEVVNGLACITHVFDIGVSNHVRAEYSGLYYYNSSVASADFASKSSIVSDDDIKTFNSHYQFKLLDNYGNPLKSTEVNVVFNSKDYLLVSDESGIFKLNINVAPSSYLIEIINPVNNEVKSQTITVVKRMAENKAFTMYYGAGSSYKVRAFDDNGNIAVNAKVKFTVNGKTYYRYTDSNGYASLKISLKPNKYTITAEYKGFKVSNKITVKPTIVTKDKTVKKGKTIKFTAKLLDSKGKILKKKKVTFKFKGKTYKVKTSKKGIATLKITKKYKPGKYTISSKYGGLTIKNKITIKK